MKLIKPVCRFICFAGFYILFLRSFEIAIHYLDSNPYRFIQQFFENTFFDSGDFIFKFVLSLLVFFLLFGFYYLILTKNLKMVVTQTLGTFMLVSIFMFFASTLFHFAFDYRLTTSHSEKRIESIQNSIKEKYSLSISIATSDYIKLESDTIYFHNWSYFHTVIKDKPIYSVQVTDENDSISIPDYQDTYEFLVKKRVPFDFLSVKNRNASFSIYPNDLGELSKLELLTHGETEEADWFPVSDEQIKRVRPGMEQSEVFQNLGSSGSKGKGYIRFKGNENGWVDLYFDERNHLKKIVPFHFNQKSLADRLNFL